MTTGADSDDLQPLTDQTARLRRLRLITGVAGFTVAALVVAVAVVNYVVFAPLFMAGGADVVIATLNVIGLLLLAASLVVMAGLLAQWLWLRAPGQPGAVLLLIGLMLKWGWERLIVEVDLWGFGSYAGSLDWSNPDIRPRLIGAMILGLTTMVVELVVLIWGSYRMVGGKGATKQRPSEQSDSLA